MAGELKRREEKRRAKQRGWDGIHNRIVKGELKGELYFQLEIYDERSPRSGLSLSSKSAKTGTRGEMKNATANYCRIMTMQQPSTIFLFTLTAPTKIDPT